MYNLNTRTTIQTLIRFLLITLVLTGCAVREVSKIDTQTTLDYDLLLSLPVEPISYVDQIKPILESRCTVCHGCYDAPCQLKLSSFSGIQRGASKQLVYDGTRIFGTEPTRLDIDANSPEEWREKQFHPILNEQIDTVSTPLQNLEQSVLYKMLRQKKLNPQAQSGMLSKQFELGLDRAQVCPTADQFQQYAEKHPTWGMPYAMPNLSDQDYKTLVQWIAQGSPASKPRTPAKQSQKQVIQWEQFLNARGNKQQLVSRYLYEHIFQAHIHFTGAPNREFYRLVRSTTPTGQPIAEIPSLRPYDDPGTAPFYYRLRHYSASIVAKDHVVYELSPQKMLRYRELFFTTDYTVDHLPSYNTAAESNPFKIYKAIPPELRYRFLLDDAKFFIEGFIKGPVCRGQIALNVIEDRFWVFFFDPDQYIKTENSDLLQSYSNGLDIPSELGDTFNLLAAWTIYKGKLEQYEKAKLEHLAQLTDNKTMQQSMEILWDGDGHNKNAALTIFRHFDSASVNFGLAGEYPKTAWVIDYPLLERIHYLLVAGFNVYGNVGHQLNTRLYMDFLRIEAEDNFFFFLPDYKRKITRAPWYKEVFNRLELAIENTRRGSDTKPMHPHTVDESQKELYRNLEAHLDSIANSAGLSTRCDSNTLSCPSSEKNSAEQIVDNAISKVGQISGSVLEVFPDLAFVRIKNGDSKHGFAYTLIRNKAYTTISSLFVGNNDDWRDTQSDSLTTLKGLHGSYPNFFFDIDLTQVEAFANRYAKIQTRGDYELFVEQFGVRRTSAEFWEISDWFQQYYLRQEPINAGLFDLNRYENR